MQYIQMVSYVDEIQRAQFIWFHFHVSVNFHLGLSIGNKVAFAKKRQ